MGENRVESKSDDTSRMENLSLEPSRFSRDLLQRFMGSGNNSRKKEFLKMEQEEEEGEGDLELSLGLSLGGRFGVDRSKLIRSSSIAACLPIVGDDDSVAANVTVCSTLVRTSSLPIETEEEWRKRKEIHSLRRLEAKRRRSEKQKNSGGGGGNSRCALDEKKMEIDVNWRQKLELFAAKRIGPSSCGVNALISGIDLGIGRGKVSHVGGHILPQGSVESQGGSPSSISALESNALLAGSSSGSNLSNASIQSLQEGSNQDASSSALRTRTNTNKNRPSRANSGNIPKGNDTRIRDKQPGTNGMRNMPCVFTKIDGPNGRRIDGILYKYGKGEEVRIMCVCHGNFFSPAEFVKHAGGSDVAHPLKHIVINPTPPT